MPNVKNIIENVITLCSNRFKITERRDIGINITTFCFYVCDPTSYEIEGNV